MYIPPYFKNTNAEEVHEFISENGFGILVSQANSKLWATHIPLVLEKVENEKWVLFGHVSRGNPQWRNFTDKTEVMAIFHGPHTYISSSWYDHENVPTWNYIAVHVYGTIKIVEGEAVRKILKNLVDKYEKLSAHPVSVESMSEKFLAREIKGIVCFKIEISSIEAAYKLSQNRDKKNHDSIISELRERGDYNSKQIADVMNVHYPHKKT
ncbi:MAG: FMN-binding negative transcriptional regulator [Bacteroidetes bacterium]|nr:FMN-binding negative transcriptional regulator [Bacteroidota bacterium]